MCISLLVTSVMPINANSAESNSLVFLGNTYTSDYIQEIKADYEELSSLNVYKGDFDKTSSNDSYAVNLEELRNNAELAEFVRDRIETKMIYFIGNGTVKDVENILDQDIVMTAPIYDKETNAIKSEEAKYSNDNEFSVFSYSKNDTLRGYGERAIVSDNSKDALAITAMRQFKTDISPQTRDYSIRKSGNDGKLYTDYKRYIWTYSTWTLFDIPSSDTSRRYYATKVNIYFNHDGKQACVKQSGGTFYDAKSIDAKPSNTDASVSWSASIPAGISVSYSGTKAKVSLSRPNAYTNQWSFSDGTLWGTAYFDSGDDFECITQWSTSTKYSGVLFCYDENGYDMYGGYTAPTMTGISI